MRHLWVLICITFQNTLLSGKSKVQSKIYDSVFHVF